MAASLFMIQSVKCAQLCKSWTSFCFSAFPLRNKQVAHLLCSSKIYCLPSVAWLSTRAKQDCPAISVTNDVNNITDFTVGVSGIKQPLKTHSCNCLNASHVGSRVVLRGFVSFVRQRMFVLIRDSFGITQILVPQEGKLAETCANLTYESYIEVEGVVQRRPQGQENQSMATGEVEVLASSLLVLSKAPAALPFLIRPQNMPTEALGLKYRYLHLRYPYLQKNLRLRSRLSKSMSDFLEDKEDFINVTTPTLACHTSGGAHLFVVPYAGTAAVGNEENEGESRCEKTSSLTEGSINTSTLSSTDDSSNTSDSSTTKSSAGDRASHITREYYCLAQSPQTYKQLLMMAGLPRYYQMALCYRDETGRPDRQPEFMQLDLEMSDVTALHVRDLVERLLVYSWPGGSDNPRHPAAVCPSPTAPFPCLTYREAMDAYGCDKPDTRFDWRIQDVTEVLQTGGCLTSPAFSTLTRYPSQSSVRAFAVPGGKKHLTRRIQEDWSRQAVKERHPGTGVLEGVDTRVWVGAGDDGGVLTGPLARHVLGEAGRRLLEAVGAGEGDAVVVAAGPTDQVLSLLGKLRLQAATLLEGAGVAVRDKNDLRFLWITDFPLFELSIDGRGLQSVHHPFTAPHPDDLFLLRTQPLAIRSQHYDLVCSGCEVGGGSVRIHDPALQREVLDVLGLPEGEMTYFVDALRMGCPPHAGIALGFDRLVSMLCGADSIRDVIAFPKSSQGRCVMSGSPSGISRETADRLGLL